MAYLAIFIVDNFDISCGVAIFVLALTALFVTYFFDMLVSLRFFWGTTDFLVKLILFVFLKLLTFEVPFIAVLFFILTALFDNFLFLFFEITFTELFFFVL